MAARSAAERVEAPPVGDVLRAIREAISEATLRPEAEIIAELRTLLEPVERKLAVARSRAMGWVAAAREDKRSRPFAESLMEQFPLDSAQGRALMSLAEALLRTPDTKRVDQLIAERLNEVRGGTGANAARHAIFGSPAADAVGQHASVAGTAPA